MAIEVNVEPLSPEWFRARMGHPTCSALNKILTPRKMTVSGQQDKYLARLLAERMTGEPLDEEISLWMERGQELEEQARAWYSFEFDRDVRTIGLVKTDDGMVSGSPDGLVGDEGGLEIKTPSAARHCEYLLWHDAIPPDYMHQVQGNLWVSEREWWDFVSFNPVMPKVCIRTYRDEKHIKVLSDLTMQFCERLLSEWGKLKERYGLADPVEEVAGEVFGG